MERSREPISCRPDLEVRAGSARRCAACHDALRVVRAAVSCPSCATTLHDDCARGLGRCPTLGCATALPRRARARWTDDLRGPAFFWLLSLLVVLAATPGLLRPAPPPRKVWPAPGPYNGPMRCVVFRPSEPPPPADWRTEWRHRCSCPCPHDGIDDPRLTLAHFLGPAPPQVLARARLTANGRPAPVD